MLFRSVLRFVDNTSLDGGEHQDMEEINMKHDDLIRRIGDNNLIQVENMHTSGDNNSTSVETC